MVLIEYQILLLQTIFFESEVSILQSTAANMMLLLGVKGKYQWGEWFGLVGINDFLSSGFSKSIPQLLSLFDSLIFSDNEYKYDQRIVDWTLGVAKYNCRFPGVGFVYNNVGGYSGRYSRSMPQCLEAFDSGKKVSFDQGDYLSYLACLSNKVVLAFSAGLELEKVKKYSKDLHIFLISCGEFVSAGKYYYKIIDNLMGVSSFGLLDRKYFTDIQWEMLSNSAIYGAYHHLRLLEFFWNARYVSVVDHYKAEKNEIEKIRGIAQVDDNHFIYAISCLQCGDVDSEFLEKAMEDIEDLARIYPPNFRHKWLLVQAEKCRLDNDVNATELYRQAAMDAKENGFIHMYALTHELHARYWQEQGRLDYTKYHITKAMQGYQRWGCVLKLENLYYEFGQSLDFQSLFSSFTSVSNIQTIGENIDLVGAVNMQGQKALLRIANMIAEELDLERRLLQITQITIENTGADQGILLLNIDGNFHPKAVMCLNDNDGSASCDVYRENMAVPFELPISLINECAASKKVVLLRHTDNSDTNSLDVSFFQKHDVQSLLCYPIIYKGYCQSVLLLTHSNQDYVFSGRDLQFLTRLAPQFAVSIENARLYQERQQFNHALEQKVEQRTQELQAANDELQAFTASVSHDLKAPLRAISGFTSALAEDYEDVLADTGKNYVNLLVSASKTMGGIIEGLLTLSRSTQITLQWEEVNVSTLVEDKVRWLRTMEPAHVVVVNVQQGLTADGDLRLIRQVIDNLIDNAWKYSHRVISPNIGFGITETKDSGNAFYVRDNGVGFDMANADELFSPFRRLHQVADFEGMGIGLATVYRIVKRHGGKIWASSEPSQGATFYFQLNHTDGFHGENL